LVLIVVYQYITYTNTYITGYTIYTDEKYEMYMQYIHILTFYYTDK